MRSRLWFIYLVICAPPGGGFLVKVGRSTSPITRWSDMSTAIPLESNIMFAPAGNLRVAAAIENTAHKVFANRRESGEWFSFGTSEFVPLALEVCCRLYEMAIGFRPEWTRIEGDQRCTELARWDADAFEAFFSGVSEGDALRRLSQIKKGLSARDRKEQAKILSLLTGVELDVSEDPFDPAERRRGYLDIRMRQQFAINS